MKNKEPRFCWDPEAHIATCIVEVNSKIFCGVATCHPEDLDFESEKVGCNIAYARAAINVLQDRVTNDLKPRLASLHQLYYAINKSKYYDETSYPVRMLIQHMEHIQDEITATKDNIKQIKQDLRQYISDKEKLYNTMRANRQKKEAKNEDTASA